MKPWTQIRELKTIYSTPILNFLVCFLHKTKTQPEIRDIVEYKICQEVFKVHQNISIIHSFIDSLIHFLSLILIGAKVFKNNKIKVITDTFTSNRWHFSLQRSSSATTLFRDVKYSHFRPVPTKISHILLLQLLIALLSFKYISRY